MCSFEPIIFYTLIAVAGFFAFMMILLTKVSNNELKRIQLEVEKYKKENK